MPLIKREAQKTGADLLAQSVGFELLGDDLGRDVESAIRSALASGVIFEGGLDPVSIFRNSLAASIRGIETHPRGELFQRFLTMGPYERDGKIPQTLRTHRLSDDETAKAIRFIHSYMVNSFKGAVTELLATKPCLCVLKQLQRSGELPKDAKLFVGDSVLVRQSRGIAFAKGADLHILIESRDPISAVSQIVAGVAEVKSYFRSEARLRTQIDQHVLRAKRGLCVRSVEVPASRVRVGWGRNKRVMRLVVLPDEWILPRTFHWKRTKRGRTLYIDPAIPPRRSDYIDRLNTKEWQITLRWSKEALTAAAHEMTFWYMGKVGEIIYSKGVPEEWSEMSLSEAGRNAAKMMLYYAILRCRTARESQRAIALYNSYGFGYSLGMNFQNKDGRREMLWPQDLDEILASRKTEEGCRIKA